MMLNVLPAGAALLVAPSAMADRGPQAKPFEIVDLAEGVYGFVLQDPLEDLVEGNSLFVGSETDVVSFFLAPGLERAFEQPARGTSTPSKTR